MKKAPNVLDSGFRRFILYSLYAVAATSLIWLSFTIICHLFAIPLPSIKDETFMQMGFFAASNFGLIIFLTMSPLQTAASSLSAGFFARLFKSWRVQIALYVLLACSIIALFIEPLSRISLVEIYKNELFFSLVFAYIFSVLLHHHWISQRLQNPWVVYQHVKQLKWEEASEKLWMELFECTLKAVKGNRIGDANYFLEIMHRFYLEIKEVPHTYPLDEDVKHLYCLAKELLPTQRLIQKRWPHLVQYHEVQESALV